MMTLERLILARDMENLDYLDSPASPQDTHENPDQITRDSWDRPGERDLDLFLTLFKDLLHPEAADVGLGRDLV